MRRGLLFTVLVLCAFGEVSREGYRGAYKVWRQTDPNLEREAGSAGPAFGADADRVANEAAKYASERRAYLSQAVAEKERRLAWLEQAPAPPPPSSPGAAQVIVSETSAVRHSLEVYGTDLDPGLQQARAMLERENLALVSVRDAVAEGRKAVEAETSASAIEEQARLQALSQSREAMTVMKKSLEEASQEASAWAEYYRQLSDEARQVTAAPVPAAPSVVAAAPPRQPAASITPLPLARYTGAWTFPPVNGLFHGPQPEFVDLVVHEQNGRADGTLFGRFKVSSGDPVLRFDFSGDFRNTRNQVFNVETSDGIKGTIELIPGPAFNLLEINFQIEPKPGKVQQGNMLLVKK